MIDINKEQRRASNPLASVWVAASAGSGKTKVLTDRVLNLLLLNGQPEKLLCLTFTKAAAAEMSNRINNILKKWAICADEDLSHDIEMLTGETPDEQTCARARCLFAQVLETAGGMKIMTIHAFCQSVLKRFPLEAGVPPNFDILDPIIAQQLLMETLQEVLIQPSFKDDIALLSRYKTADGLVELLQELFNDHNKLLALRRKHNLPTVIAEMNHYFHLTPGVQEADIISEFYTPEEWKQARDKYLTKAGRADARRADDPEAQKAQEVAQSLKNWKLARITGALLHLAFSILERYQIRKQTSGVLDYNDLIESTKELLSRSHAAAWVLFKLDGGINHILVDEAQDTNPDQWVIIRLLAEEFFSGLDQHDTIRTIFAVGDKKQSIFSFQGSDPEEFERMHLFFQKKVLDSENEFQTVPFNLSFRSTAPVLELVNRLLDNPEARRGVLFRDETAVHLAYRQGEAGLVEVWPSEPHLAKDAPLPWKPPMEQTQTSSAMSRMAERIANKIATMIQNKEILESQGRPITAGDFLILVQRRDAFVVELERLLKERQVPVAGIDRLDLSTHIAVQDLIAAAKFALLPEDDLNLACLLKSPLIGLNEEELYQAAYNRGQSTLWERVQRLFPKHAENLNNILNGADKVPPYEFFATLLGPGGGRKRFLARLGNEVNEALDEFLNRVLAFEQTEVPSLQRFVNQMAGHEMIIKRDMESGLNAVRIMTVHASKGLQGRIVFLPQKRYIRRNRSSFIWLNKEIPVWVPVKEMGSLATQEIQEHDDALNDEENRRLLYVAVTRASDRLYVCGCDSRNKPSDGNWYDLIRESLPQKPDDEDGIIRIKCAQEKPVVPPKKADHGTACPLPDWANKPAPIEPPVSKPLMPSRPENQVYQSDSPADAGQEQALKRGQFLHKLLQYLPLRPPKEWDSICQRLKPDGIALPENFLSLLTDPRFTPIFKEKSIAEVPVVGVWQNRVVSGQIDRLILHNNEVWIVDFKTNHHVPNTPQEVPPLYKEQLAAYRGLIQNIFSDKLVRTFLLWTETFTLMEIMHETDF